MALAQDLMGLGLPHSLALHIAEGGTGPRLIAAPGSSFATATKIAGGQGAVYCTTADSTKGVALPTVGSGATDGPLFVDDFIIANVNASDCLKVFASSGVSICASGTNTSVVAIAVNTAMILYPVTASQWVGIRGN